MAWQRLKISHAQLTDFDIELLASYSWPVREPENVIGRAVIISQGGPLRVDLALGPCGRNLNPPAVRASVLSKQEIQRGERKNILKALDQSKGKIYGRDGAAEILGMKPTTLTSRMKKMRIRVHKVRAREIYSSSCLLVV